MCIRDRSTGHRSFVNSCGRVHPVRPRNLYRSMESSGTASSGAVNVESITPVTDRDFDLLVYGIGYTGKQVCEQLIKRSKKDNLNLRLAIAARNKQKLDAYQTELDGLAGDSVTISTFVISLEGDIPKEDSGLLQSASSNQSLVDLLGRCHVCIDTAGPYRHCGEVVVRSCIRACTHYVDCNGEPDYSSLMARKYWNEAASRNVLFVYSAGFDSVPVDMGCFKMQQEAQEKIVGIQAFVNFTGKPETSHGTTKTLMEAMAGAVLEVPDGPAEQPIPSAAPRLKLFKSKEHVSDVEGVGRVKLRMVPDANNVLWSHKLNHNGSAEGFEYAQYVCLDGDQVEANFGKCFFCCLGLCFTCGCIKCACCRGCLESMHGEEGTGPSDENVSATHVDVTFQSRSESGATSVIKMQTDEMYVFTAQALAEAGLCLRYDQEALPKKGAHGTPGALLGAPYLDRLVGNQIIRFK
eukprot:TRINITY_DN49957_c0_g1_i1.p1 TRINITY_DN49957_c0_g1~~TRINITY_DN49957_c0_g1_i1.p1  ORF type:complete len:465 (+),score=108.48 TRINITY_DN49957_c0_g1_i1:142-1536(+)